MAARRSRQTKSTGKTTGVAKRAQPHGGSLNVGGTPGNRGGSGRPPSFIRDQLRGSIAERTPMLEAIMDGEAIQRASIPLIAVLKYASCPKCGDALKPNYVSDLLTVSVEGRVSASPKDRIAAYDTAAKYGLGALKEVSVENVRERVGATLDVIRSHCPPAQAASLIAALRPVWA